MATLTEVFNPMEIAPNCGGIPFPVTGPEGIKVVIVSDEIKQNSKKDGGFLRLNFEAIEGEHKGARIPWILNLFHTNPTTVGIAKGHLSAIAHCLGQFDQFQQTEILHNRPLRVVTRLQAKEKPEDPDRAEIVGVLTADGNKPGKVQPAQGMPAFQAPVAQAPAAFQPPAFQAPAAAFQAPAAGKMPWELP